MKFYYIFFVDIVFLDLSVDVIVVVYCFYWFVNEEVVRDICRVLVFGGFLGMIWIFFDELVFWVKELLIFFCLLENGFEYIILEEIMNKIF